jgi:epoxyqueuosine reductase
VDANPIDLIALFDLDDEAFRRRFRDTPLWRAKRRGILRNAAIVLGNQQQAAAATTALTKGLTDPEPLVREACGWALARIRE